MYILIAKSLCKLCVQIPPLLLLSLCICLVGGTLLLQIGAAIRTPRQQGSVLKALSVQLNRLERWFFFEL